MTIQSLVESIYEDLNASITSMHLLEGMLTLIIECDDWLDYERRRSFELRCLDTIELNCSPGPFGELGYFSEHPLLFGHSGGRSTLYFSSIPDLPAEIFLTAHEVIASVMQGWRAPQEYLGHDPSGFEEVLAGGHGLLAIGPDPVIDALEQAVSGMLRVNKISGRVKNASLVVLTADQDFIVCGSVEVTELRSE